MRKQRHLSESLLMKALQHIEKGSFKKVASKWMAEHLKNTNMATRRMQGSFKKTRRKLRILFIDRKNKICYGPSAPKFGETIWVKPHQIKKGIPKPYLKEMYGKSVRLLSAKVISRHWPLDGVFHITDFKEKDPYRFDGIAIKLRCCMEHWVNGLSWEETGLIKYMEEKYVDGRINIGRVVNSEAIRKRYSNLDNIFEQVKREGGFRLNQEVDKDKRYKWGPSQATIHLGPGGEPFWGSGACHRFAIAQVLMVPLPARLGLVHKSAIPFLNNFRSGQI